MRRPQFSLKTMLVMVAGFGALVGGFRTENELFQMLLFALAGALIGSCIGEARGWPLLAGIVLGPIFVWPVVFILCIVLICCGVYGVD
jgi:hypothetical protein